MKVEDLRIPSERGFAIRQLNEAYANGQTFETVHRRKNGRIFPVEIAAALSWIIRKCFICNSECDKA